MNNIGAHLPYSPLYQSIRIVLFGALGLSAFSMTAGVYAATPTPSPSETLPTTSESVITDSTMIKNASPSIVEKRTIRLSKANQSEDKQFSQDHNKATTSSDESAAYDATTPLSAADASVYDSDTPLNVNTNNIATQPNDITPLSQPVDSDNITPIATDSIATQNRQKPAHAEKRATAASNPSNSLADESIQRSLERLAEFYQLSPETEKPQRGLTLNKFLGREAVDNSMPTYNADPNPSSIIDPTNDLLGQRNSKTEDLQENTSTFPSNNSELSNHFSNNMKAGNENNTANSSARCEGRWVYPKSNPNYQRPVTADGSYSDENAPTNAEGTLFAQADYGYYDNIDYAELSGNVIIDQGAQHIEADKIIMDLTRNVAAAEGQVLFTDAATNHRSNTLPHKKQSTALRDKTKGGIIGVADSLAYNTETGQSTAKDVAFASVPLQAHGYAKMMNRPNDSQYELDEVMFTTCPPTDRKWQIDAKNIDLDTDTGRGKAYNTTFRIKDVPVLYLPYFNFPIDDRRASGFLIPRASFGSESGIELDVPYYFDLAPNYDATLNTHIYTNRNPMLTGEFRYLTRDFGEGQITGSYLANDKEYNDEDRTSLFYDHYWTSKSVPRLTGDITYQYVSDADYLNDFDTLGLSENTINLPRRARLSYYNDYINGDLKLETYQSLKAFGNNGEPIQDKDKPYSRLPQLNLEYRLPWSDAIELTGVHDSAYFKKSIDDGSEAEKSGVRIYNKLNASYPLEKSWGYVEPKLSLQHLYTSYDQDSLDDNQLTKEDGSKSVFVPQFSVDSGLHLYRPGSPFGWYDDSLGGYQLLSPRLKYTYAPFKNQNDLPNFNTRIASINYDQLYADSWFLGHDRLQDLHALTPGLNYRYIDAMGVTRFDGSIAEQFYFDDGEVTLSDQSNIFTDSSSGVVWEASTQPYRNFWVDLSGAFTNNYDLNYVTTQLRYQPTDNSLFNLGYIKRRQDRNTDQLPLSAVTASTIFPINNQWRVLAQGQYDLRSDKMLDALVGVDYEDCCFGFAVYGRRYYNDLNLSDKPNQAVMAEIRLNGLSNNSSRLTRLLSDKVQGFEPVQTAWKDD